MRIHPKTVRVIIQLFKFILVGLLNTGVYVSLYSFFVYVGIHYIVAGVIAFFISVLNAFYWNNKYVFTGQKRKILLSLIKVYISYGFTGLIIQNILLFILVDIFSVSKYIAPFFVFLVVIPMNFILNKLWALRPVKDSNTE